MNLRDFHIHLDWNNVKFHGLGSEYDSCIYVSEVNGNKFTLPREDIELKRELIFVACDRLGVPLPLKIEQLINSEKDEEE